MDSNTGGGSMETAVRDHSKAMLRAAYSVLRSTADAEDAVQDAFLQYMRKRPAFHSAAHEKAWLIRVTVNIAKNMMKSAERNNLPMDVDIPYHPAADRTNGVLECALRLEEKYRIIIHLYYYEGYSLKEIASILQLPLATVGTRLARGRKQLKTMLKEEYDI